MQLFTLSFNAHAHNITAQKLLLRKSSQSFDIEGPEKAKKFSVLGQNSSHKNHIFFMPTL